MSNDLRTAAQQALEAMERYQVKRQDFDRFADEITALCAALAEPQEPDVPEVCFGNIPPVGWLESPHGEFRKNLLYKLEFPSQLLSWQIPLYAHLRAALAEPVQDWHDGAIEGYLPERGYWLAQQAAPAAPTVEEPVAFVNAKHLQGLTLGFYGYAEIYTDESAGRVPLYTAPPRPAPALTDEEIRDLWSSLCVTPPPPPPPAALTDEEMKQLWKHHGYKSALCMRFARAIEAAHGIGEPK